MAVEDGKLQLWEGKLLLSDKVNEPLDATDRGKLTTAKPCCCPQSPLTCPDYCVDNLIPDAWELTVSGFSGSGSYCSAYQCACEDGTYYLTALQENPCFAQTGLGAPAATCRICQLDAFSIEIRKSGADHFVTVKGYDQKSPPGTTLYTWEKNYGTDPIDCWNLDDDIPWVSTDVSADCTPPASVHVASAHGAAATDWPQELCRNCDDCGINFPAQLRVIPTTDVVDWLCRYPYVDNGICAEKFAQIYYLDRFTCTSELSTTQCLYKGAILPADFSGCASGGWYPTCRYDLATGNNIEFVIEKNAGTATTTLRLTIDNAFPYCGGLGIGDWTWEETYAIDGFDCNNMDASLPMTNNPRCYHTTTCGDLGGSMCDFLDTTAQVTAVL